MTSARSHACYHPACTLSPIAGYARTSLGYLEVVDQPSEFGEILCWAGWWDVPRFGVSLVEGTPYYFDCQFSEDLDDYPEVFLLWPIPPDELSDELAVWEHFANWRQQFDLGNITDPHFMDASEELERVQALRRLGAPANALHAIPQFRLDTNRQFAQRRPCHSVRWRFVEDGAT